MSDHRDSADLKTRFHILSSLPLRFRSLLLSMYSEEPQIGIDGERYDIDRTTRISPEQGMLLYHLCLKSKPNATLEIGLAYGFSTLYFLAALCENGIGHHTAIDPLENGLWHGVGRHHVKMMDSDHCFRFIESNSVTALTQLANNRENFEVIFIDGNHRFDDVLVDFTLSAELCTLGGYIVLDDVWLPSIRMVAAFIRSNRGDFEELPTPLRNIAAFRRISHDNREWNHYVQFPQ